MKPVLVFVYDMEPNLVPFWKDGLWAALRLLEEDFMVRYYNLADEKSSFPVGLTPDFVLGWGAFGSYVSNYVWNLEFKKGLCIGGNAISPQYTPINRFDVLFYETDWYRPQIASHRHILHAFGVNTDIFKPLTFSHLGVNYSYPKVWDYITVGAYAYWKRQIKIIKKDGHRLSVGQIQKKNIEESIDIVGDLILGEVMISDMVTPERLSELYNASKTLYIPANVNGGGERAILEARACGLEVEIEKDNPKLAELLTSPIWDHHYYAAQLKKGILACLK